MLNPQRAAASHFRPGAALAALMFAATAAHAEHVASDAEVRIIAAEIARLQQTDSDLDEIPGLDALLFERTAVANVLVDEMSTASLRILDQLGGLTQLPVDLSLAWLRADSKGLELSLPMPAADCSERLRSRLAALPGLGPADALRVEPTATDCRVLWRETVIGSDLDAPGADATQLSADSKAPELEAPPSVSAHSAPQCVAMDIEAALAQLEQATELRLLPEAQRQRRAAVEAALAEIDARLAPPPDHHSLQELAIQAGVDSPEVDAVAGAAHPEQKPVTHHLQLRARAGLPAALTLLEALLGRAQSADDDSALQPWINRRLDSVELARTSPGSPLLQIRLRQYLPAAPGSYIQALHSAACWPKVTAGDGAMDGLTAATRERVHSIRSRFSGPLRPLPRLALPAARRPIAAQRDPFIE